jgi:2-polyprenyl-3-methyl-5-hydroxy-6-metoxy-1,4-benzoquinol methylase
MNVVRVVNCVQLLRDMEVPIRTVLEVGSFFGSFALPLQRLGYQVTAVDRYASYGEALSYHMELISNSGATVVSTHREDESAIIDGLGRFDCVLAGAVIEHIPHTPRLFLESLRQRVKPGGVLILDTPNLTRYWNRKKFSKGESVFSPLEEQFHCEIPYEGHHREYTGTEMCWMMRQIGCRQVQLRYLDYNFLQFKSLSREHIDCLAAIIQDPSLSDTILVAGILD